MEKCQRGKRRILAVPPHSRFPFYSCVGGNSKHFRGGEVAREVNMEGRLALIATQGTHVARGGSIGPSAGKERPPQDDKAVRVDSGIAARYIWAAGQPRRLSPRELWWWRTAGSLRFRSGQALTGLSAR